MTPFMQYATDKSKPIVFIAPDFEESCLAGFYNNVTKKTVEGALILSPGMSKQSIDDRTRDLSVLLGGRVLHTDVAVNSFKFDEDFGLCERMIIHTRKTEIIDPNTDEEVLRAHIQELQAKTTTDEVNESYSEFEVEAIRERIAHMTGGVATILVGARTPIELGEKKDRYEDAVNAVRAALAEGVVPGASTPLLKIAYENMETWTASSDLSGGVRVAALAFGDAISMPAKILIKSARHSPEKILPKMLSGSPSTGFDGKREEIVDLFEKGIVDPLKVIKNSLIYAENVAETFMMIDCAIISDLKNVSVESLDETLQDSFFNME
jgi:chaperonin GroEL